jgi:LemA protein
MSNNDNQFLQAYMEKMLEVQKQREESYFSPKELREIALSVGMSEADWEAAQKTLQMHLKNGDSHLNLKNYVDALAQYEEAIKLNPCEEKALYGAAKAAYELFSSTGGTAFSKKSVAYANRALENNDPHLDQAAIKILQGIRVADGQHSERRERKMWYIGGILLGTVLLLGLVYFLLRNSLMNSYHEVEKSWAQVENVCQRRADLIPKLISISQSQANHNQKAVEKLKSLQEDIKKNKGDVEKYAKQQEEMNKLLTQLLSEVGNQTGGDEGSLRQQFNDLRAQIEGAENRISVERKRYNEAVAEHNTKASKFPFSLVSVGQHKYFRSSEAVQ